MLVVTGAGTQEVAEFIMLSAEAIRRVMSHETAHTSDASLDAAVILFEPIVQVGARPVPDPPAQGRPNRPWIGAVPVACHPARCEARSRVRRAKERLCRRHISALAEHRVNKISVPIDRAIQIGSYRAGCWYRLL
jgi:hypothetical protein